MFGGVGRQPSKISLRKTGDTKSSEGASKSESQDKVAHFKLTDLNNTGSANGKFGQGKYQVEPDKVAQSFKNVATVLESFKGNEEQIGEKSKEIEGLQGEIAKLGEQEDKGEIDELNSRIKNLNAEITTLNAQSADDSVDVGLQTFSKEELSALNNPEKADGAAMRKIMLKLSKACEIELMTFKETKMPNDKLENLLVAYESVAMQTEGLDDLFKDVKQQSRLKTYSDGSSKIKDPKQGKHNKAHVGTAKAMLHWYCETVQKNSFDKNIGKDIASLTNAKKNYNTEKPLKSIMDKLEARGRDDGKVDHKNIKLFFENRIQSITDKKIIEFQRKLTTAPDFTDPPKAVEDGTKAESKSWFPSISSMMSNISMKKPESKAPDAILARDLKQLETAQMEKDDRGILQVVDSDGNPIAFEGDGLAGGTIDEKLEGLESKLSDGSGLVFSNETFDVSDLTQRPANKDTNLENRIDAESKKPSSMFSLGEPKLLKGLKKEVQLKKDISALKDPVLKADKQLELRQTQLENFKRELTEQKKTEKDTTNLKDIKEKLQNIESDISKIKLETKCRTAVKKGIDQVKTKQQKSKLDGLKSDIKTLAETAKKKTVKQLM